MDKNFVGILQDLTPLSFFVIFLNLHGNRKAKEIVSHTGTISSTTQEQKVKALDEDENVLLMY